MTSPSIIRLQPVSPALWTHQNLHVYIANLWHKQAMYQNADCLVHFRALAWHSSVALFFKNPCPASRKQACGRQEKVVREYFYLDFSLPAMKYISTDF